MHNFCTLNLDYLGCPTWLPSRCFYAPFKEKELQSFRHIAGVAKISQSYMMSRPQVTWQ
jgi:hypothetical protein